MNGSPVPKFDEPEAHEAPPNALVSPYYHQQVAQFIKQLYRNRELHRNADVGFIDIAAKSMGIMQKSITRFRLAAYSPDLIIEIPGNACAFHEFHRAREMIELGRRKADQVLSQVGK